MHSNRIPEPPVRPSAWLSAIPFFTLVILLSGTLYVFGSDSLGGPSQIVLLTATAVCIILGMSCCHVRWSSIEASISEKIRETSVSICILLLIGMLSASWMVSGIVPTLICYGIQTIHPVIFLLSACVISAVVSLMTGSSWTTIATIGIALLGIGRALGFDDGWTAGAIISGAYFGDKISPLSDTTVLASSVTGTPLFQHIRYMMLTTMPTLFISLFIFGIAGIWMGADVQRPVATYTEALSSTLPHHTVAISGTCRHGIHHIQESALAHSPVCGLHHGHRHGRHISERHPHADRRFARRQLLRCGTLPRHHHHVCLCNVHRYWCGDAQFPGGHTRYAGHAGHHPAHPHGHDFRWRHDGMRHATQLPGSCLQHASCTVVRAWSRPPFSTVSP